MIMYDIVKVLEFAKENNFKIETKEGIVIVDNKGCIVFESSNKTKCFKQASMWIDNNRCEKIFQ